MKTLRLIINILLGFGCVLAVNESDTFVPNLIGVACFLLLFAINPKGDGWLTQNNNKK